MIFNKIIIGIGGNINSEDGSHPIEVCNNAISSLKDYSIKVEKHSKWYNSEPIPKSDQPNFFNCVIILLRLIVLSFPLIKILLDVLLNGSSFMFE